MQAGFIGNGILSCHIQSIVDEAMACTFFFILLLFLLLFSFSRQASPVPRTSGCSVQRYYHGTLRRELSHGRVDVVFSVSTMAPSGESCPMDERMGC